MTRSVDIHRDDPILGRMRRCRTCPPDDNWWPEDPEFFYFQVRRGVNGPLRQTYPYCKACWSERKSGQHFWHKFNDQRRAVAS